MEYNHKKLRIARFIHYGVLNFYIESCYKVKLLSKDGT